MIKFMLQILWFYGIGRRANEKRRNEGASASGTTEGRTQGGCEEGNGDGDPLARYALRDNDEVGESKQ